MKEWESKTGLHRERNEDKNQADGNKTKTVTLSPKGKKTPCSLG